MLNKAIINYQLIFRLQLSSGLPIIIKELQRMIDIKVVLKLDAQRRILTLSQQNESNKKDKPSTLRISFQKDYIKITALNFTTNQSLNLLRANNINFSRLIHLQLGYQNNVSNVGCKYLSRVPFPKLKSFNMSGTKIGYAGFFHLSKSNWKLLSLCNFASSQIGKQGVRLLTKANWSLRFVELNNALIQADDIFLLLLIHAEINQIWLKENANISSKSALIPLIKKRFVPIQIYL